MDKNDDIPLKELFHLVKDGFFKFSIQKLLFEKYHIQIIYKKFDNSKLGSSKYSQVTFKDVETLQFMVKIKNTYRSIIINRQIETEFLKEDIYNFGKESNRDLIKYRDQEFIPLMKNVIRKLKIENVLNED